MALIGKLKIARIAKGIHNATRYLREDTIVLNEDQMLFTWKASVFVNGDTV